MVCYAYFSLPLSFVCIKLLMFIVVSCLILFVLANLSAVAISRPHFGINIPRFVSSVLLPTKVNKLSVWRNQFPRISTYRLFVKPGRGAPKGS